MNSNRFQLRTITRGLRKAGMPGLASCLLFIGGHAAALADQAQHGLQALSSAGLSAKSSANPLRRAAKSGDMNAQYLYATDLLNGRGIAKNESAALRWLRKAARQGHVEAQFQLGLLYLDSETLPEDEELAYQWINRAVENGHPAAGAVSDYMLSGEEYSLGC